MIVSRDDSTGAQGYKRVVRLFRGETNRVVHLKIAKAASVQRGRSQRHRVGQGKGGSSSDGEEGSEPARSSAEDEQTIRCTTEHPFWVQGRGWVPAGQLRLGDELSGSEGEQLVVSGHEVREEHAKHYNFEVEGFHTYFVSETKTDPAVWVHNTCWTRDLDKLNARITSTGQRAVRRARLLEVRSARAAGRAYDGHRAGRLAERFFNAGLRRIESRLGRANSPFTIQIQPAALPGGRGVPGFLGGPGGVRAYPGSRRMDAAVVDIPSTVGTGRRQVVSGFDVTVNSRKSNPADYYREAFPGMDFFGHIR